MTIAQLKLICKLHLKTVGFIFFIYHNKMSTFSPNEFNIIKYICKANLGNTFCLYIQSDSIFPAGRQTLEIQICLI